MKLKSLALYDLFSFKDSATEFDQLSDKILICGVNNDVGGMDSNGSGKTSIFNSIYWILYGKTLDKRESNEIVRRGEDGCLGSLTIGDYIIERQIGGGKELHILKDKKEIKGSTNTKTQEIINEILGCDYKAFKHSHYLSSDFSDAFIGKGTTPKERFEVFEKFIDSDMLNSCKKFCEDRIKELKEKKINLEGEYDAYNKIIEEGEDKEKIKHNLKIIVLELEKLEYRIIEINKNIKYMETVRDAWLKSQSNVKTIEKIEALKIQKIDLENEDIPDDCREELKLTSEKVASLAPSVVGKILSCPKCNAHLLFRENVLEVYNEKIVNEIKTQLNISRDRLRKLEADRLRRDSILSRIVQLENQIVSLEETISKDNEMVEFNETEYDDLKNRSYDLQKRMNELLVEKDITEREIERITKAKLFIKENKNKLNKLNEEMNKYSFWKDGFQNIKINRISSIIPLFESETNNILSNTFDCDMSVIFKTTRELKSGGIRNELNIYVNTSDEEMRSFESLSMGEQGRVAIAVTLARNTIFSEKSNLDFILIDELLDGLDATGQQFLVDIINNLSQQVLIISHSDTFKNHFTDNITVEKTNGVSNVVNS